MFGGDDDDDESEYSFKPAANTKPLPSLGGGAQVSTGYNAYNAAPT